MAKGKISLSDFPVAERRKRSVDLDKDTAAPPISHVQEEGAANVGNESAFMTSSRKKQDKSLETTPEQHRASAIENANRREDSVTDCASFANPVNAKANISSMFRLIMKPNVVLRTLLMTMASK